MKEVIIQVMLDRIDPSSNMWTRKRINDIHSRVHVNLKGDENKIREEYLTPIANSLAELRPDLVKDWNYEKNGNLKPTMFGINSNDHVWWKCAKCGYKNPIEITEIYDSDEAWNEKLAPVDPDDFYRALKRRSDELDEESQKS